MLKYEIYDGKVSIIGVKDKTVKSIVIPDTIEGYPVTIIGSLETFYTEELTIPNSVINISWIALRNHGRFKYINGQPVINGFCVINNRFIYYLGKVYNIRYNISGDHFAEYSLVFYKYNCYFIDGFLLKDLVIR